jgi:hypothetical protein
MFRQNSICLVVNHELLEPIEDLEYQISAYFVFFPIQYISISAPSSPPLLPPILGRNIVVGPSLPNQSDSIIYSSQTTSPILPEHIGHNATTVNFIDETAG